MMRSKIEEKFPKQNFFTFNSDKIFVMDYSNQTKRTKGLECSDIFPADILPFIIQNDRKLDISFCLFKENTIKLADENKERSHCEGVFFPDKNAEKTWLVFLELKYPKRKNLGENLRKAREQLIFTLDLFRKQGIIETKKLVYLIFSAPNFTNKTPFENWSMKPDELKKIKKTKYAIMRGINSIEVISNEALKI